MNPTILLVGLTVFAGRSLSAQAADCLAKESITDCWHRLDSLQAGGITSSQADEPEKALAKRTAGISSLGNSFASTINDFLPQIAGALGLTQTTTEDGATSLETNLRLPLGTKPQRVRLQGVLRKASLYQPLADSLADGRTTALEKGLGDFDDVRIAAAWNLESRTMGRSFEAARVLSSHILREQIETATSTPAFIAVRQRAELVIGSLTFTQADYDPATATVPGCEFNRISAANRTPIGCFTAAKQAEVEVAVAEALKLVRDGESKLADQLEVSEFYRIGTLVNNQPQFNLEFGADVRNNLVGPDGLTFTARYEGGFTNLNGLRSHARAHCGAATDETISGSCLRNYLSQPGVRSSMDRGDRFFISAAVSHRSEYLATLPDDSLSFSQRGGWDLIGNAGYGRYLTFSKTGEETGRLDLTLVYIHHYDDPNRQNRLVASGTYTYRISANLVFATGISYASRPEFLGDVNHKVSANFGLRYRLVRAQSGSEDQ
ncbi:MAG: hypothetical protein ABJC74_04735 [Gemmatimonadota bacterium]